MAIGDIGAIIDTEIWEGAFVGFPFISHLHDNLYIISRGNGAMLYSIFIDNDGGITPIVDSLNLDGGGVCGGPKYIRHIDGDVYAVARNGRAAGNNVVETFTCDDNGIFGAVIDTEVLSAAPGNIGFYAFLLHATGNIYIVAYTDSADDGWIAAVRINNDGSIDTPVLSSWEVEADRGRYPWLIYISGNMYAIITSSTASNRSKCRTFTVSDAGVITSLGKERLFDTGTDSGNGGIIRHVSGDVYAIFWQGADLDGWIYTLSIDAAGNITNIDNWEFVTTYCTKPHAYHVSENQAANGQIFVVGYSQNGATAPQVFTVEILNNGTITKSMRSQLTLVAADYASDLSIVRPGSGIYAACYKGSGEVKSFDVEEKVVVAPTVATDAATSVEETTATPNGLLDDDGGEACDCGFEWGLDTDYGTITSTQSKTTGQTFSQAITGLVPNTTYHFRAIATNSAGTSYGADRTFTIKPGLVIDRAHALSREEL